MATTNETQRKPSALMLAIGAMCRPSVIRVCPVCAEPAKFGDVTCGRAACLSTLIDYLWSDSDEKAVR